MSLNPDLNQAYQELDLRPGAGLEQVKHAYRRLAKASHPDLNPWASGQMINRINRAYRILLEHLAAEDSLGLDQDYTQANQHAHRQSANPKTRNPKTRNPKTRSSQPPAQWRLLEIKQQNHDLVYRVELGGRPASLSLPLRKELTCTHCSGQGERRVWGGRVLCAACRGKGRITKSTWIKAKLPLGWQYGHSYRAVELDSANHRAWLEIHPPAASGEDK